MLKIIYRTHKERVQTTRSQPELPLFKLIKCACDLWPFGNREDTALRTQQQGSNCRQRRGRVVADMDVFAVWLQLFGSVQSSPVQSSPQSSPVQSPGFTETCKLVMKLRVQYSLVQMNGETQLYIMQLVQMRSNLYKWGAEHNAKFICFANLYKWGVPEYSTICEAWQLLFPCMWTKTCVFCKTMIWCIALKIYSSNILLPLQVHTITSKGSFLIDAHLVWSQTMYLIFHFYCRPSHIH